MICRCDPNVACWSVEGIYFIIKEPDQLAKNFIPNYFEHNKFQSFTRQLNFYGFKKINNYCNESDGLASNHVRFEHKYFRRGRKDLLHNIKRTTNNSSCSSKVAGKEIEALKKTVSDLDDKISKTQATLDDKISKLIAPFEARLKEMENMLQASEAHSKGLQRMLETSLHCESFSHQNKRQMLNNYSTYPVTDDSSIPVKATSNPVSALPEFKGPNITRQCSAQSNQSDFHVTLSSLINDENLNPDSFIKTVDNENLLFPDQSDSKGTNATLPTFSASSYRMMPDNAAFRLLSDLSANRSASISKEKDNIIEVVSRSPSNSL